MSAPSTIYLVTGANRTRGLGLAFVSLILSKHLDAFVYATVRDPTQPSALDALASKYPTRLAVVKWVAADVAGNKALAEEIASRHGRVDTVIANAALLGGFNQVHELDIAALDDHYRTNVLGVVVLFQALYTLLQKSKTPRFIPISSIVGSIGDPIMENGMGYTAYASSKTVLNWITRKIHFENEWLVAFPLSPGSVDTDMADYSISNDTTGVITTLTAKYGKFPTADKVAVLLLEIIDNSTRENNGGQFMDINGTRLPW